jgi:hypothetical protein
MTGEASEMKTPGGGHGGSHLILVTLEAEIRRIMVQGQHGQKVHENPSQPIKSWVW